MKAKLILISFLISCCFISCEKEKTNKDDNPDNIIKESATINESGGTISIEGLELIIPEKAFASETELTLTLLDEESDFGEDCNSQIYLLEGLPVECQKSLQIKIKHKGNATAENYIVVGEEAMEVGTGEENIFYEFVPATDSSGFMIGEYSLPVQEKKSITSSGEKKWVKIAVVSNFLSEQKVAGNDKYTYDIFIRNTASNFKPEIIGFFDEAYKVYLSELNFKYEFYFITLIESCPMNNILVTNLAEDIYCKYIWKINTNQLKPAGKFVINAKKIGDTEKMRLMIAREVFRSILFQHSKSYPKVVFPETIPETWLNQALLSWTEEFFSTDKENYIPSEFPGNELAPLYGIDYGKNLGEGSTLSKILNYGNGMSALVEFLSKYYLNDIKNDTIWAWNYHYNISHYGNLQNPVELLVGVMNQIYYKYFHDNYLFIDNTNGFWFDFLNAYLSGEIYNVNASTFINSIGSERTFNIGSQSDTLKNFKDDFPELSAQLYKIEFQNDEIRKNGTLNISLKENIIKDAMITVYALENGKLYLLGRGSAVIIAQTSNYQTLIVAVGYDYFTENHNTFKQIELEIKYRQQRILSYPYCTISTSLYRIRENNKLENPDPAHLLIDTVLWNVRWYLKGKFTDYSFEGNIDAERQGGGENISGGGIIKLDDELNIIELHVNAHHEGEGYNSTWGMDSNQKLELTEDLGFMLKYEAFKNDACNFIDYITGYYEDFGYYDKTTDFYCGDISEIWVKFSTDY